MHHKSIWEIVLSVFFPGIGQIIWARWGLGISLLVFNGLTIYILWIILMPISLGILLYDRRIGGLVSRGGPRN